MQVVNHIEIRDGTAYIVGRAVKAKMVARAYIDGENTFEEIMAQYTLMPSEVHAALAYYYDNKDALDAEYQENLDYIKRHGTSLDKLKAKIAARNAERDS
ncbi:MAG: DUF433 domain-containing protein [Aggregatilineales bacterium]